MKITSSEYSVSAVREDQYPRDVLPEIALAGRSNVGKSSLINSFLNRKNLARTSSQPGKTQTLNFYKVNDSFYLVDVPGYGYAKVSKKQREQFGEMIQDYLETRANLEGLIIIIDARHEPTTDDIAMYNYALLLDLPILVVTTKMDKLKKSQYNKVQSNLRKHLDLNHDNVTVLTYSSETKLHLAELNKWIEDKIS
ncbi:ribosome biogenesis GTP-binding protein YihA/YsxC [Lactobacillus jensenii]|jgi:ribosome biogenesis GTP-binding protein ysxC|uniref:Probable GTP-binding protein EngB n=1 Tax=Lactobacillus jensenii TaxID=109790 RepID=A0A5N1IBY1_LACJE|nr:ribosome biogenesis GTP-binding protein YihA/YsxC [Lactobacillus jensenii]EEQ68127.1 ribosome biogenesis GTP-binding protein YsxC [Lactobacillus jensenii 1153]APT14920.1 YihA family ribosome biogenesis GTP-binding protein [Lactobacillus jensenii]EEQ24441.1 ribosome biogenesis GTP-binding protein YsxC [Lactobacillus jensenii 269-3]EEX27629.1 ribosome biogenesis GTP-binding protein YsxC [Lactobacillus jensenii SJ-7A-US]KAA9236637.1 YihA family ribosome biogenesis GTP-binding protein [Lactobac